MKLTRRGIKAIVALGALTLFAIAYLDPVIASASIALAGAITADYIILKNRGRKAKEAKVEPDAIEVNLVAGETQTQEIKVVSPVELEVSDDRGWVKVGRTEVSGEAVLPLEIAPKIKGEFTLNSIRARFLSRLKLFEEYTTLPIKLRVKSYPRVLPYIIEALKLILLSEGYGIGEYPSKRKGIGFEYYESREYVVGDDPRLIDWKASARLSKLIVREYLMETAGASHIVYDMRYHGPITADEAAAMFMSSVLSVAEAGLHVSLTIKSGRELIYHDMHMRGIDALKVALANVLKHLEIDDWDIYDLVEPEPTGKLLRILRKAKAEGLAKLVKYTAREISKDILFRSIRKGRLGTTVTYIGSILYDSKLLIDLAYEVRNTKGNLRIFTPSKPWLDAKNLEESYMMYKSFNKIASALERLGADLRIGLKSVTHTKPLMP